MTRALYYARFGRLRPGKDDRLHDSMDDDNIRQFSDWIKHQALTDAVFRIIELERILERINMTACYASEEDTSAQPEALLQIGKLARGEEVPGWPT